MKRISAAGVMALTMLCLAGGAARGADFWETYGNKLVYNYSIRTGATPAMISAGGGLRLSNSEVTSILTKTFSQSLKTRVGEMTKLKRGFAIVCIFSPEPDKCLADGILNATFKEVRIVNAPTFSDKFLKKMRKYYAYTLPGDGTALAMDRVQSAAARVPQRKKFNPRFSLDLGERQIIAATPFYSFFGVYVEPKYGSRRGPALSVIAGNFFIDAERRGLSIKRKVNGRENARGFTALYISAAGDVFISNEYAVK